MELVESVLHVYTLIWRLSLISISKIVINACCNTLHLYELNGKIYQPSIVFYITSQDYNLNKHFACEVCIHKGGHECMEWCKQTL